jgi:hypothetical protein
MSAQAFDGSRIGYYTYMVADDHWSWSDGMYGVYGYPPRAETPSTALLIRHLHRADMARVIGVLETVVRDGLPFSCPHRIIDNSRQVRSVLAVGRGLRGDEGEVEQLVGFLVDLTGSRRPEPDSATEPVHPAQTLSA